MDVDAKSVPATQGQELIDRDLPCVRCGYNLRMQSRAAQCPECGSAVALTLELGGELQRARPGYLRRLTFACWMLAVARLMALVFVLVAARQIHLDWLVEAMAYIGCLYAVGAFLLTGREHPRLEPELPAIRRSLRVCSALVLIGAAGLLAAGLMGWMPLLRRTPWLMLGTWFAYCLCPMLEMPVLVRLSRRVSDGLLREHAIIAGIGATASGLLFTASAVLHEAGFNIIWAGAAESMYVMLGLLVALLLFWIWTAYVSVISALHLGRAWAAANARWRKHTPVQD